MDAAAWANVIASGALVVSVASGVFAWRAVDQARKANKIGLHAYQKEVYQAFFEVYKIFVARGRMLSASDIAQWAPVLHLAPMYLDEKLVERLREFYAGCFEIENIRLSLEDQRETLRLLESSAVNAASPDAAGKYQTQKEFFDKTNAQLENLLSTLNQLGRELTTSIGKGIKIA